MSRSDIRAGRAFVELGVKDNVSSGLRAAMRYLNTFGSTVGAVGRVAAAAGVGFAGLGAAAALALKPAVDAASDLGETTSKVGQIFGSDAAAKIAAFGDAADKAIGQSKRQAMDAAATFATFGKAAGLTGDSLVEFSTELTTLASDLASFGNTSPEDAIIALGAALRGESEPIRNYGVLLDDATLRQEALALGIIETTKNALTPQQRVLAAHAVILKQTRDAQGDFARTSDSLANAQRVLAAGFENLAAQIGEAFLPAVEDVVGKGVKVLEILNDWVESNGGLSASLQSVVEQMGGVGTAIKDLMLIAKDTGTAIDDALAVGDLQAAWDVAMLGMKVSFVETLNEMIDVFAEWSKELGAELAEQLSPQKILDRTPGGAAGRKFGEWLMGVESKPEDETSGVLGGIGEFLDTSDDRQELARRRQELEQRRQQFDADPFNQNRNAPVKAPVLPPDAPTKAVEEMTDAMRKNRSAPVLAPELPDDAAPGVERIREAARGAVGMTGTFSAAAAANGAFGSNPVVQELKEQHKTSRKMLKTLENIDRNAGLKFA